MFVQNVTGSFASFELGLLARSISNFTTATTELSICLTSCLIKIKIMLWNIENTRKEPTQARKYFMIVNLPLFCI